MPKTQLVSPGDSIEKGGCRNGSAVRERGGSASGREVPAVNREWPCVFRGPEDGRRVLVFLEAAPQRPGSVEGPEDGAGRDCVTRIARVYGARNFACISPQSLRLSSSRLAKKRAPSLRCSSRAPFPCFSSRTRCLLRSGLPLVRRTRIRDQSFYWPLLTPLIFHDPKTKWGVKSPSSGP